MGAELARRAVLRADPEPDDASRIAAKARRYRPEDPEDVEIWLSVSSRSACWAHKLLAQAKRLAS